jgi:DNA-binding beta-propeller fold protein YncE
MKRWIFVLGSILLGGLWVGTVQAQGDSHAGGSQGATKQGASYSVRTLTLPDNSKGDIPMDYIAYDASTNSVWVPGGLAGAVYVVDAATGKVRQVSAPTAEVDLRGGKRVIGPSGVSVGEGVVYIGNRADSSVCAFDARSLAPGPCGHLDSAPDGVAYVVPTKEVWVTTPRDKSVRVLDAKTLAQKAKLTYEGNPEGYAVDPVRGRFYTNLEDMDRTLAIDLKSHQTVATWNPSCGKEGPHGLGLDAKAGHLFIACSTLAEVMDVGHDGAVLSMVDTGDGVDDIHYESATHMLYVGAAKDAKLTIARADDKGRLTVVAQVPTQEGARNATVTKDGTVYLAHSTRAKLSALVVVSPGGK